VRDKKERARRESEREEREQSIYHRIDRTGTTIPKTEQEPPRFDGRNL